jgi:cation diffusion facilitator family transporter
VHSGDVEPGIGKQVGYDPILRETELQHEHHFDQHRAMSGEGRTRWVVAMTATTMVVEIAAGVVFGSMALLADGLHMASHAAALGLAAFAYAYARRHAHDRSFSFGTGKVNSLAGFGSAVVLVLFAVLMGIESVKRFLEPVPIAYDQAIAVAVLGLVVNGISVFILRESHDHDHGHQGAGHHHDHHDDHNLRAAHLHVLADALTSVLAIAALVAAKYFGVNWMDPAMGIVGGVLVARWSWGLVGATSRVLLDRQAPQDVLDEIRTALGTSQVELVDLHVWDIGPGYRAAIIAVETSEPINPGEVKQLVPGRLGIAHLTVEVHHPEEQQLRPAAGGGSG